MNKENKDTTKNAFFEYISLTDFDTTVSRLLEEIERKSWKLSHVYDLQKTMENHNKKVLPVKVISLCHANHSSKILESDSERIVSSMMPCRVSVYEKHDGKTYISMLNSSALASSLDGISGQVMIDSANEVEDIIKKTLQMK